MTETTRATTGTGPARAVQPSLLDLGTPLPQVSFCVVDLETTGAGPEAAITEIGAVRVRGGETLGEFQTFVDPGAHIPASISVLTGITDQMVRGAPDIAAVLPGFLEFAAGSVLVAHNARFDVGFLKRACHALDYPWPAFTVVDTMVLARAGLLRDEVPNCKLSTLAAHFRTTQQPDHRALSDARATVEVLYGLLERLGNLGVTSLDDLTSFAGRVSPQRRAKRVWARDLPDVAGVYWFWVAGTNPKRPDAAGHEVLYVGKSRNLRRRVATYFTASETRARMEEMLRIASGVGHIVCATPLEAEVRELRLIAAHDPRYNRRSRRQDHLTWVKLTHERFPRLSLVRAVHHDDALYWGPFTSRLAAEQACQAIQEAWPLRQCSQAMSTRSPPTPCALAELRRCLAPCLHPHDAEDYTRTVEDYTRTVEAVRDALTNDIRPTVAKIGTRMRALCDQERFEEADIVRARLEAYLHATRRRSRLAALARCPQIVAAEWVEGVWQIHIIRYGRLAAATTSPPGTNPRAVARAAETLAATVLAPDVAGLPAGSVEEAELIASWLERPGVRLMDIDGDWSWPVHAGATAETLPQLIWRSDDA
ncbi:MAG: DEDD exonuclease domain-containing protein [Actinomycetia bacterium]|nr:DEDD exonuclease domain-containing protein [Actinomycetes bacterium]